MPGSFDGSLQVASLPWQYASSACDGLSGPLPSAVFTWFLQLSCATPGGWQLQMRFPSSVQGLLQDARASAATAARARAGRMEPRRIAREGPAVKPRPRGGQRQELQHRHGQVASLNDPPRASVQYKERMRPVAALLAAVLLLPGAARASPADARALARRVQGFYERTQDLEARFTQTYRYAALGRAQVSRGTLKVKKPGMIRWDYLEPERKVLAVKGSRLVQYEPEANQAYVDPKFDASAMSAAVTFLVGKGDLLKEFDASVGEGGALVLRPKKADPRVESVALTVGPSGEVSSTRVVDGSGNVNQIAFEDIRRNVGLRDADFEVALPRDVHRVGAPGGSPAP